MFMFILLRICLVVLYMVFLEVDNVACRFSFKKGQLHAYVKYFPVEKKLYRFGLPS